MRPGKSDYVQMKSGRSGAESCPKFPESTGGELLPRRAVVSEPGGPPRPRQNLPSFSPPTLADRAPICRTPVSEDNHQRGRRHFRTRRHRGDETAPGPTGIFIDGLEPEKIAENGRGGQNLLVSHRCGVSSLRARSFSRRRNITLENARQADVLR